MIIKRLALLREKYYEIVGNACECFADASRGNASSEESSRLQVDRWARVGVMDPVPLAGTGGRLTYIDGDGAHDVYAHGHRDNFARVEFAATFAVAKNDGHPTIIIPRGSQPAFNVHRAPHTRA